MQMTVYGSLGIVLGDEYHSITYLLYYLHILLLTYCITYLLYYLPIVLLTYCITYLLYYLPYIVINHNSSTYYLNYSTLS